jgi:LysM repeat protein
MSAEVEIAIIVSGYEKRSIEVVEDAYSRNLNIDMEKESIKTEEKVCDNKSQVVLKGTIAVQDGNTDIAEVFNVVCKPIILYTRIENEKVIVEGMVQNKILYMDNNNDQQVCSIDQEVPFEHSIEVKGIKPEMGSNIDIDVDHCNYSMFSSNEVEVRLVLTMNLKVFNQVSMPVVVKVTESPQEINNLENQPSIIIYFTKPGDNLWKIAKRYFTTIEDIRSFNTISENEQLSIGQQIVIPKRVS